MGYSGDDQVLIRIAVFGIAMSVICTAMITVMLSADTNGDYDFDEIQSYRDEVSSFTGDSMLSSTPWVLQHVYTPWVPSDGIAGHVDDDDWLFGEEIDDYPSLGKAAGVRLDMKQKSSVPITVSDRTESFQRQDGVKWWADSNAWYGWLSDNLLRPVGEFFGRDPNTYSDAVAAIWNYTGYRYVFDPTLPFLVTDEEGTHTQTSVRDGALSLVWYTYNGQEGLSGGLDVYGGRVLLASYSAVDIVSSYNASSGYATSYDFNFEGTHLTLSIRFDANVVESGVNLMQAWSEGDWSLAITSVSAGNFLDINNSTSYSSTGGAMIKTFIQIYTMQLPNIHNDWMNIILWLLVGLPMTLSMALVTLKVMEAVKIL